LDNDDGRNWGEYGLVQAITDDSIWEEGLLGGTFGGGFGGDGTAPTCSNP